MADRFRLLLTIECLAIGLAMLPLLAIWWAAGLLFNRSPYA